MLCKAGGLPGDRIPCIHHSPDRGLRLPAAPHQTPLRHTALEEERAVDWYEDSDYYKESGLPRSHIFPGLHPAGDSGRATRDQAAPYHLKGPTLIGWQCYFGLVLSV